MNIVKLRVLTSNWLKLKNPPEQKGRQYSRLKLRGGTGPLATRDHVDEVMGEDEGHALPLESKLALVVAQEVTKVNMEELCSEHMNLWIYEYMNMDTWIYK